MGLRTINERINQIEPLPQQAHNQTITEVPAVVQLDSIWLPLVGSQETSKVEKRGRRRHQRKGRRVVVLVVLPLARWQTRSPRLGDG